MSLKNNKQILPDKLLDNINNNQTDKWLLLNIYEFLPESVDGRKLVSGVVS
ncbi:MAG: hypothetical protein WCG30_01220 [Candidatus Saccharibacteria bacterium]